MLYAIGLGFFVIGILAFLLFPFPGYWGILGGAGGTGLNALRIHIRTHRRSKRQREDFLCSLDDEQVETALALCTKALSPSWADSKLTQEEYELVGQLRELHLFYFDFTRNPVFSVNYMSDFRPTKEARPLIKALEQRRDRLEKRISEAYVGSRSRQSLLSK